TALPARSSMCSRSCSSAGVGGWKTTCPEAGSKFITAAGFQALAGISLVRYSSRDLAGFGKGSCRDHCTTMSLFWRMAEWMVQTGLTVSTYTFLATAPAKGLAGSRLFALSKTPTLNQYRPSFGATNLNFVGSAGVGFTEPTYSQFFPSSLETCN